MAAVYKSLSKKDKTKAEVPSSNGVKKNKQRVLVLSSRGVTFRWVKFSRAHGCFFSDQVTDFFFSPAIAIF